MNALAMGAVAATALFVALAVGALVRPVRRLAPRVRPYTLTSRTSLGRSVDVLAVARPGPALSGGTVRRLFGPPVEALARSLGRLIDASSDDRLLVHLHQAGLLEDVPEERRVQEYRVRQLASTAVGVAATAALLVAVGASAALVLVSAFLGGIAGATRWRRRLDRAIEDRRERLRIELYTVDHLLAMHVRVGGGVLQAVQAIVRRGTGTVVEELREALRAHASGVRASDAFTRIARLTPEPAAARTYRLLATGAEHGADLAQALLALAEDVRDARRDALERQATKRRAAMLVPTIAVLAPVMLLFIAAPLPSLIFGLR